MKKAIWKFCKLTQLRLMAVIARYFPCLASRWGLVSIYGAIIQDGPGKGLPLGIAWAMDCVRKA